jgi:hypothetical protein
MPASPGGKWETPAFFVFVFVFVSRFGIWKMENL